MRACLLALALALVTPVATLAAGPVVRDVSTVDASGHRILQNVVVVHATPAAVWKAQTDAAAYKAWAAPAAFIDLRIGGMFEAGFSASTKPGDKDNIQQQILAYIPERLIVFRNLQAPVPGAEAYKKLAIIVEIKDLGGGDTEVRLSHAGYGSTKDDDALYAFFKEHNPEYLADLAAYLAKS